MESADPLQLSGFVLLELKVDTARSSVDRGETMAGRQPLSDEGGWRNRNGDGAREVFPEV